MFPSRRWCRWQGSCRQRWCGSRCWCRCWRRSFLSTVLPLFSVVSVSLVFSSVLVPPSALLSLGDWCSSVDVGAFRGVVAVAGVVVVVVGATLFVGAVVRGVGVGIGTAVGGGVAGCGAVAGVGAVLGVGAAGVGGAVFRWRCAASVNGVFRQSPVSSVHSLSLGLTVLCAALFSYPWNRAASLLFLLYFLSFFFPFPHPFLQSRPWRPFRTT